MNAYQLRKQVSPRQTARNLAALNAKHAARPLHRRRLVVEAQIWPQHETQINKARGEKRQALVNAFNREVNGILFPVDEPARRAALKEASRELNEDRLEALIKANDNYAWFSESENKTDLEVAKAHAIAAGFLAGQIERSL